MKKHEDHICRFNDGEQICDCFHEGYEDGVETSKTTIEKGFETLHGGGNARRLLIQALAALDELLTDKS